MNSTNSKFPQADFAESTSTSLLIRALGHESGAWDRIVQLYGPLVYGWCRKSLQQSDASDVTQEVLMSVSKNLLRFNYGSETSSFRGWLRTITKNKVIDEVRKQKRKGRAPGGSDAHAQLQQVEDEVSDVFDTDHEQESESLSLLRRALDIVKDDFSEAVWQVFLQTTFEGRSNADVAEELGKTTGYVRNISYRVRKRLQEELGHFGDFQL